MTRQHESWRLGALCVVATAWAAACGGGPTSVEHASSPSAPLSASRLTGTQVLAVTVLSEHYNRMKAGNYSLTASVTGGTPPYYFEWEYHFCYTDLTCTPWESYREGESLDSIAVTDYPNMTYQQWAAKVGDSHSVTLTGVGQISLIGPYSPPTNMKSGCPDGGVDYFYGYPFTDSLPADSLYPFTNHTNNYNFDTCTGKKTYEPYF